MAGVPAQPLTSDHHDLALATRGLHKAYGSRLALDGLDLSVPSGVVYGFLGPNGAGKTTTMRLLTGLIHPDGGAIEILGQPFSRRDRHRLYRVGALVESPTFYPYLSGRANMRELAAVGAPVRPQRIEELLELVGLQDRANDPVQTYSLGMKQRLGIAAALLSDPQLLLLDEPANGLDPAGIVAMRDTLRYLASQGKTVFVSSHQLAEVQVMADVVGIIAAGRLVREGRLADMLAAEGAVKVHVRPEQLEAAMHVLAEIGPVERLVESQRGEGWLTVHVAADRAEEINRALAASGVYASGLDAGSDLEMLFLALTGDQEAGHEGTFVGLGAGNGSPGRAGQGPAA